ncbi:alpha/beta fold hydrolase [Epilithonimonas lactis]|nr:alpha/beta hydrolase [Epilithonimonas lactis]SEP87833.1 Pimeloyl-ACP methyl ester carboxylesterase [Epilithonimonas lactis]
MLLLFFSTTNFAQSSAEKDIEDHIAKLDDQQIHYLKLGSGPKTLVLLHGWPETSLMWKQMMPKLLGNNEYTIITPDLRGINGSSIPTAEFDKATLAKDVHKLIQYLKLKNVIIIGHDIGGMVTYAYARLYPKEILGFAILDVPLPGLGTWDQLMTTEHVWHFRLHDQKPLAEELVLGKQDIYFRYFIRGHSASPDAVADTSINSYANSYSTYASLNAGFEWYRAFGEDVSFNRSHKEKINVPLLLVGAEFSMKESLTITKDSLQSFGITNIRTAVVDKAGHYIVEEKAEETFKIISKFISEVAR